MKVEVQVSGIWQTNSTILATAGGCVVIDPAYFPRELQALAERAAQLGGVTAVVFSHGHWDHVMGASMWPDAPVWLHAGLCADIRRQGARAARYLADAREFDSRWYVPRPGGHRWPEARVPVADGHVLDLGGAVARAMHLPGHSPDGLGVWVESAGVLLCGDYLSACEIPFVEDADAYAATLRRLIDVIAATGAAVIPGHGPRHSAAEALVIARADLEYVERLAAARADNDRDAALAAPWPRAHDVVGMREAHVESCAKIFGDA